MGRDIALARMWLQLGCCDELTELLTDQLAHWKAEFNDHKGFRKVAPRRPFFDGPVQLRKFTAFSEIADTKSAPFARNRERQFKEEPCHRHGWLQGG